MSIEAEFYCTRKDGEFLEQSQTVFPGSCERIDFLGERVRIMVICDIGNTRGTILLQGTELSEQITAIRYKDAEDNEGEVVSLDNCRIAIVAPQELTLITKKERSEAFFFLSSGEDDGNDLERDPQGTLLASLTF